MAAAAAKRAVQDEPVDEAALRDALDALYGEGPPLLSQPKVMGVIEQWFSKFESPDEERVMAMALLLAIDLELFAPSLGGAISFDRLARRRRLEDIEVAAVAAVKQACFVPMRIRSVAAEASFVADNLSTGAAVTVFYKGVRAAADGATVAARLVPLPSGHFAAFGPVTPLDEAGLAVALDFLRPGKRPNDQRCAAAVYRHVMRNGNPVIFGFNDFSDREDETDDEVAEIDMLDSIAVAWHRLQGAEPSAALVEKIRETATPMTVVEACVKCFVGESHESTRGLVAPYRWILQLHMETLQRRASAGSGADLDPFDTIAAIMDREIRTNGYPPGARALFIELRKGFEGRKAKPADDELTRVIERIRALRAKTLDQGCTEAEALAAATKVAELLDRYGLSLSEIDIRRQTCEGVGIDSTRKRRAPLDDCLNAIADFCACRAWQEITTAGTLRSIFFGLPADVEAAHFLYGRVEAAFGTETQAFHAGPLYAEARGGERRAATNSFQVGLGNGICAKLRGLTAERDGVRSASSRDLVVVKRAAIDEEMSKLGLAFKVKSKKGRRVDVESFRQGQMAARKFEARDNLD